MGIVTLFLLPAFIQKNISVSYSVLQVNYSWIFVSSKLHKGETYSENFM